MDIVFSLRFLKSKIVFNALQSLKTLFPCEHIYPFGDVISPWETVQLDKKCGGNTPCVEKLSRKKHTYKLVYTL